MKKAIIILGAVLAFTFAKAQSGLQFSQAKFFPVVYSPVGSTYNIGTVPAGKVWKLEQAFTGFSGFYFTFNGSSASFEIPTAVNGLACWWPAGTVINVVNGSTTGNIYISILEFTVVQ